jgi:hypothetical protein
MLASQHSRLNALDFSATAHRRENVCRDRIWNISRIASQKTVEPVQNYILLGEHASIKALVDGCFADSCKIRATQVNHAADDVRFHVGRSEGSKITAHFNAGVLSIRKRRINPREPLNAKTCTRLFEALQECSKPSNQSDCRSEHSSASGFSRKKFDQACRAASIDRRTVGRQEVDRLFVAGISKRAIS